MHTINKVTLLGHIGGYPEFRKTAGFFDPVDEATIHILTGDAGHTDFHLVTIVGAHALLASKLAIGTLVYVDGELRTERTERVGAPGVIDFLPKIHADNVNVVLAPSTLASVNDVDVGAEVTVPVDASADVEADQALVESFEQIDTALADVESNVSEIEADPETPKHMLSADAAQMVPTQPAADKLPATHSAKSWLRRSAAAKASANAVASVAVVGESVPVVLKIGAPAVLEVVPVTTSGKQWLRRGAAQTAPIVSAAALVVVAVAAVATVTSTPVEIVATSVSPDPTPAQASTAAATPAAVGLKPWQRRGSAAVAKTSSAA